MTDTEKQTEGAVVLHQEEKNEVAIPANHSVMDIISKAVLDKDFDVAKLEKLMDLNDRVLNREAEQAYARDFVQMKPKLPRVIKLKDNSQTKSKYAPLEDINDQIDKTLAEFGFGTSTRIVCQDAEGITVEASLLHRGGHSEKTQITMPFDNKGMQGTVNKTMPHATASSVTYAKRVAICALLNISTGDDKDGNSYNEALPNDLAVEIDLLITESGADKAKFLAFMKVDSVQDIKTKDYVKARKSLEQAKAVNSKKGAK